MIFIKGSTTTSWLICMCLCGGFLINPLHSKAQQTREPDSLFIAGNFREAAVEYEREFYFASNKTEQLSALIHKSECYNRLGDFKESYRIMSRALYDGLNDTLIATGKYKAALAAYLGGDFTSAESELIQLFYFVKDSTLTRSSLMLFALALNEQRKWKEAGEKAHQMVLWSEANSELKNQLNREVAVLYDSLNYPRLKSQDKAEKWATFIPGAGHIYAGYTGEGIMNFVLQAGSLGFVGYHIYISHYITAFTIGSGMFQHFYFGGINRVRFLVDKRNDVNLRKFNDPLREKLISIQQQLYGSK